MKFPPRFGLEGRFLCALRFFTHVVMLVGAHSILLGGYRLLPQHIDLFLHIIYGKHTPMSKQSDFHTHCILSPQKDFRLVLLADPGT